MTQVPDKIWLFRMVHWSNVVHVLSHGICSREHANADPNYVNIGHRQLIDDRHHYEVPIDGAGEMGEYVPFYFAGHSPMLYLIMKGYKGVTKRDQEDIVFFLCDYDKIKEANLPYVFTDRNAKLSLANFYDSEADFDKLHWDVIRSKRWENDIENIERQDLKQAEFLVRNHLPVECIYALVLKTDARKSLFDKMILDLGLDIKVIVDKNCKLYY